MALCAFTLRNWRTIKAKLALGGVITPLQQFKSMHDILDVAEYIWFENQTAEKLEEIQSVLYKVDLKKKATPDAFTRDAEMSGFKAFQGQFNSLKSGVKTGLKR